MKWLRFAVFPLIVLCVVAHVGTRDEAAVSAATSDNADARIDAIVEGYENDVAEKQSSWTSNPLVWVGGGVAALFVLWKMATAGRIPDGVYGTRPDGSFGKTGPLPNPKDPYA